MYRLCNLKVETKKNMQSKLTISIMIVINQFSEDQITNKQ